MAELRENLELTQAELAIVVALGESTVAGIESEHKNPSIFSGARIADALGVPLDSLIIRSTA